MAEREDSEVFVERLALWLARLPEHTAVFAASDETAVLVARAARMAQRHIPRSLTLLSVDNIEELCDGADPPISSIQLDFEREGFIAAQAMAESISSRRRSRNAFRETAPPTPTIGPLLMARRKSTSGSGRHESWILEAVDMIRSEACALLSKTDTAIFAIPDFCGFRCYRALDALSHSRFRMGMRDGAKRIHDKIFGENVKL